MRPAPAGWLLDISRSLSRVGMAAATGIDRVERAYVRHLAASPLPLWFLARIAGGFVLLDRAGGLAALAGQGRRDLRGLLSRAPVAVARAQSVARARAVGRVGAAGLRALLARHLPPGTVAFNVGHSNLSDAVMAALAPFAPVVLLHDLIPLTHPQFAAQGSVPRFEARLRAALAGAARLLVNSQATAADLANWAAAAGLPLPPLRVAPLGLDPPRPEPGPAPGGFVTLGTIEPRKNHALLLDLWEAGMPEALHIIGRRGWENHAVFARLDRRPHGVIEHGPLPDPAAARVLAGARALLFPSRAEGYGLPLAEALSLRVPVVATDLPALREVGGGVPVFLPPDDPAAWRAAILDLSRPDSALRASQLNQLKAWSGIDWQTHFDIALQDAT